MNETNTSRQLAKTANNTDNIDIPYPAIALISASMNIMQIKVITTICPAIILANRRAAKTKGLIKQPINSIKGIKGIGIFNHQGTPGALKISW